MRQQNCSRTITSSLFFPVKAFLLAVFFICFSTTVFAQVNISNFDQDTSTTFLSYIFGKVSNNFDQVLYGGSLFGSAIKYFNVAISLFLGLLTENNLVPHTGNLNPYVYLLDKIKSPLLTVGSNDPVGTRKGSKIKERNTKTNNKTGKKDIAASINLDISGGSKLFLV
jgi:hypothetical protein